MPIVTPDGNWEVLQGTDLLPDGYTFVGRNRCLRCGVRIFPVDRQLHDDWHEALFKSLEQALYGRR